MVAATIGRTTGTAKLNGDECWEAVAGRDAASDGLFFTAVRTTKIYCRPSCPSRRPNRENVRFYATADEAEAAGYRACKRCHPREAVRSDVQTIRRICTRLESASVDAPTLEGLAIEFNLSPFHLQRTFKRIVGVSPRRYYETHRADRLKRGIRNGDGIAAAVYGAGFGSSSRAYTAAPSLLGMTPGQYGRGGAGMRISYAIATCAFGRVLVAATPHGVSAVSFGDSDRALEEGLHREYPAAEIARDDGAMRRRVADVVRAVERGNDGPPIPLDIRATAFRARVWQALREIPRGETRSYSDIARQIGAPKGARAVGNACKANPVAGVIPCHRVVRHDGSLGGYLSGVTRKRAILDAEQNPSTRGVARTKRRARSRR